MMFHTARIIHVPETTDIFARITARTETDEYFKEDNITALEKEGTPPTTVFSNCQLVGRPPQRDDARTLTSHTQGRGVAT